MQRYSFAFGDPTFEFDDWTVSVQVITFENTYGVTDATIERPEQGRWELACDELMWAGGQESADGSVELSVARDDGVRFDLDASHSSKIRSTKLIVRGLPSATVLGRRWHEQEVTEDGAVYEYPPGMHTPLMFLETDDGEFLYFRSEDEEVRRKRFVVYEDQGETVVELLHEESARRMTNSVSTPTWVVGRTSTPERVVATQQSHVESAFGLEPWERREDVPDWARQIALVASIHGMHWSGYVFNDYDDVVENLRWIADRIDPERVLVFMPGWSGRYYWEYGDYGPAPRMGGESAFRDLVSYAHGEGFHLMPMYGMNCANTGLENFEQWGEHSHLVSAGGHRDQGNKPDWDSARAHDPGWQAWLNPGAAGWRNRLLAEVSANVSEYDLDAVFFDTHHVWQNDPNHDVYEGLRQLKVDLHEQFPDLLVTGEGWYDALGSVTPMCHHESTARFTEFFSTYNRRWAHLSRPDPGRGSTGVHEAGYKEFTVPDELTEYQIPTLTLVDDSLETAPDRAERIIENAKEYEERYLDS